MNNTPPVRNSRVYFHRRCGDETVVMGQDFERLSNPYALCSGTMCCSCGKAYSLKEFEWSDTGETIRERRRRLRSETPIAHKLVVLLLGPALSATLGVTLAFFFKRGDPTWIWGGAFAGAVVFLAFLVPAVFRFLLNVDYRQFE